MQGWWYWSDDGIEQTLMKLCQKRRNSARMKLEWDRRDKGNGEVVWHALVEYDCVATLTIHFSVNYHCDKEIWQLSQSVSQGFKVE